MPRTLSEAEFNAIKAKVLASAPDKLSESDFNRWVGPAMAQALGEAENSNPVPEGSATSRFVSGAAKNLNPITAIQGIYGAVRHPIDTGGAMLTAQFRELQKANEDRKAGRYSEMVGHGAAGMLPVIGPAASAAGERMASGDIAGGAGEGAGLMAPFVAVPAVKGAVGAVRPVVQGVRAAGGADALDAIANVADRASTNRIVDVGGPKVGPNKLRLNNQLAKVAPDLARAEDLSALSRQGLQYKVEAKLAEATANLDGASDARLASQQVHTAPLVASLDAKIADLTAGPVDASQYPSSKGTPTRADQLAGTTDRPANVTKPAGQSVEPAPNAPQIATLRKIRNEIASLGPVAPYESVRRVRQAWDQVAKVTYSPAVSPDFLAKQGEAVGASQGTGAIREALAAADPSTAAANADYSFYKTANDVLRATEETQRARPRVLRGVMARTGGAMVGAESGGIVGAGVGALMGAMVERASELAPTSKIIVARQFAKAADLLRGGKAMEAQAVIKSTQTVIQRAKKVAVRSAVPIGRTLEPVSLPMAAGDRQDSPATIGRR